MGGLKPPQAPPCLRPWSGVEVESGMGILGSGEEL